MSSLGVALAQARRPVSLLQRMPAWGGAVLGVVLLVAVWWIVAVSFFTTPSGRPGDVPEPQLVFKQFFKQFGDSTYWHAIGHTGGAALQGYVWGNVIALVMALLVVLVPRLDSLVLQLAVTTSCVPITAIGPIVTLLRPAGSRASSVFLAATLCIFTTVVGALLGLRSASSTQLDVVTAYGGGRWTQLRKVQLIAALPSIMAALKLAAPAAFLGAVLGEYFLVGVDSGVGILLLAAQSTSASVRLWSIALLCAAVAGAAYGVIAIIGKLVAPWSSGDARAGGGF